MSYMTSMTSYFPYISPIYFSELVWPHQVNYQENRMRRNRIAVALFVRQSMYRSDDVVDDVECLECGHGATRRRSSVRVRRRCVGCIWRSLVGLAPELRHHTDGVHDYSAASQCDWTVGCQS